MRYFAKKLGLPTHYVWATLLVTAFGLAFIFLLCKWIGFYYIIQGASFK